MTANRETSQVKTSLWDVLSYLYWPSAFLALMIAARMYKFHLSLLELPQYLLQDFAVACVFGIIVHCLRRRAWRSNRGTISSNILPFIVFTVVFWLSLVGLIVSGLLNLPVNAKLFYQLPSFMFVRSALGVDTVSSSLLKMGLVAVVGPLLTLVGACLLQRKTNNAEPKRLSWWAVAVVIAVCVVVSRTELELKAHDSNAVFTLTQSTFALAIESDPIKPPIEPEEFFDRVATLPSQGVIEPTAELTDLRFAGTQYDIVLYVLETGAASIMRLEDADSRWLPHMRELARRSINLRRHLSPTPTSTRSIFSLVSSRYAFPHYLKFVVTWPDAPFETFLSMLAREGYQTIAFSSIVGDYDRMDTFLGSHGMQEQYDRYALSLTELADPTYADDGGMIERYLSWLDDNPSKPYAFWFFPSNSHWPFHYEEEDMLFPGEDKLSRYKNSLQYQDRLIGRLLDGLAERGRLERTIFVLVPDHAAYFNLTGGFDEDKSRLGQFHVPVLIDHPKLRAHGQGVKIDYATSHVDIGPTLLDMCSELKPTVDMQGVSFLQPIAKRRLIFAVEDFANSWINATDGKVLVHWRRGTQQFDQYSWEDVTTVLPRQLLSADDFTAIQDRMKLFFRYQVNYLKQLAAGR